MCPFVELGLLKISTFYIFVSLGMIVSLFYFVCTFNGTPKDYPRKAGTPSKKPIE